MRKIFLSLAALASLTMASFADLGSTKDAAIAAWGSPDEQNGKFCRYSPPGWLIAEIYDENDRAIFTAYTTTQAIDDAAVRDLNQRNMPPELNHPGVMIEQKSCTPLIKRWTSPDYRYVFENGVTEHGRNYRMYCTIEGFKVLHTSLETIDNVQEYNSMPVGQHYKWRGSSIEKIKKQGWIPPEVIAAHNE
jgi:hypothetical protein